SYLEPLGNGRTIHVFDGLPTHVAGARLSVSIKGIPANGGNCEIRVDGALVGTLFDPTGVCNPMVGDFELLREVVEPMLVDGSLTVRITSFRGAGNIDFTSLCSFDDVTLEVFQAVDDLDFG